MPPRQRKSRKRQNERRTVLLVTNGRTTERTYLAGLGQRVDSKKYSVEKPRFINGDPLTLTKELGGPRWDVTAYDEVWIVVDHDGKDRLSFLDACRKLSRKRTVVHGVVSVPCFEVWLNAHYEPVRNYQDQADAQRHYATLTNQPLGTKDVPDDFPWDAMGDAVRQCHLPTNDQPDIDTQGPCPSTTMPHLLLSLGIIDSVD